MDGIRAARLPWLLKRAAMKLPMTPSSTLVAAADLLQDALPASRM